MSASLTIYIALRWLLMAAKAVLLVRIAVAGLEMISLGMGAMMGLIVTALALMAAWQWDTAHLSNRAYGWMPGRRAAWAMRVPVLHYRGEGH